MTYIHGYSDSERQRLSEQSTILEGLLHDGTVFGHGEITLEAGCGVGAQTEILTRRHTDTRFVSIDMSNQSILTAKESLSEYGRTNVRFANADITDLPFAPASFDHVFICFVLEHLGDPHASLVSLRKLLKPGGTLTAIEGDHEACVWTPQTHEALIVWRGLIKTQQDLGHDPLIGRRLFPLLDGAGFDVKYVEPRVLYGDGASTETQDGIVNKIIVPMMHTTREDAIKKGYADSETWDRGMADLEKSGDPVNGSFFYSWFKAMGVKPDM